MSGQVLKVFVSMVLEWVTHQDSCNKGGVGVCVSSLGDSSQALLWSSSVCMRDLEFVQNGVHRVVDVMAI